MSKRSSKLRLNGFLLSLLLAAAPMLSAAPPEDYPFLDLTRAMQTAAGENKPMLLYFGRYGCSTCRKMHSEIFTDQALRKALVDRFVLAYVDTESDRRIRLPNGERTTEMQFAVRNRILGTPTFIYFDETQQPLFKKAGFQTVQQMQGYNSYVADGHYREQSLKQFQAVN
jgi:thioredoxin-related protein